MFYNTRETAKFSFNDFIQSIIIYLFFIENNLLTIILYIQCHTIYVTNNKKTIIHFKFLENST